MGLSQNILKLRKEREYTQKEFAEKLGVSQSAVTHWENGTRTPSLKQIKQITETYGIKMSKLIQGNDWDNVDKDEYEKLFIEPMRREGQLRDFFKQLNDDGQEKAVEQVELLTKIPEYQKEPNPQQSSTDSPKMDSPTNDEAERK